MASFWFWLIVIVGSIIAGAIFFILLYGLFTGIRDKLFLRRGIPKRREGVSEFIKENPEKFEKTNPGRPLKLNKEEEEKNARSESTKFREFEKLRRTAIKGGNSREGENYRSSKGDEPLHREGLLQTTANQLSEYPNRRDKEPKPRVKLDS